MTDWKSEDAQGWDNGSAEQRQSAGVTPKQGGRDWRLIEKLVMSLQSEQRRSRRWGIFFKLLTFVYLFALLLLVRFPFGGGLESMGGQHTALVEINGPIAADEEASADNIVSSLRGAFENEDSVAVVLRINSPGGSPVQSGYVYDEIHRLRDEYPDKKVYAVISDVGASGAYYIASAADEIYANRASLVGSIGVVAGGFGFTGIMDKLGIERRLYTAGENKAFLDPFSPERDEEVAFWQGVLENTHQQFIDAVKRGRGDRLADDERLFSGLVWSGEQALELGLVDGLGSTSWVAREVIGQEALVDYSQHKSLIEDLMDQLAMSFGQGVASQMLESRLQLR